MRNQLKRIAEPCYDSVYARQEALDGTISSTELVQTHREQAAAADPHHDRNLWRPAFLTGRSPDQLMRHRLPSSSDGSEPFRLAVQITVQRSANAEQSLAPKKEVETIVIDDNESDACSTPTPTPAAATAGTVATPAEVPIDSPVSRSTVRFSASVSDLVSPSGVVQITPPGPPPPFLTGANSLAVSRPRGASAVPRAGSTYTGALNPLEAAAASTGGPETAPMTNLTKKQRKRRAARKAAQVRAAESAIAEAVAKERESLQGSLRAVKRLEKLTWTVEEREHMDKMMTEQPRWIKSHKATGRKLRRFVEILKRRTGAS